MKYLLITIVALLPFFAYSQNYYAVLITGDTPDLEAAGPKNWNGGEEREYGYDEFWNDTYLMWELLYLNGFSDDNIFVLFGNGNDWFDQGDNPRYKPQQYGFSYITDYPAYVSDVENIFTWLANGNPGQGIPQLTAEDVLFVWTFDHGDWLGGCTSTLCLMNGQMIDYDFAALVDQIACSKRIFWMQQCFSGGFADDLENNKTSILTACNCDEGAYPADDINPDGTDPLENEIYNGVTYHHGEFNYHIMNAVRKKTIVNHSISTDSNNDGEVSFLESKNWEFIRDSYYASGWSHPQYSDIGNIGTASFTNILMDLAYQNKAANYDATAHNNNHILERGFFGKLHEVFQSDGEIFYRRSNDNGSNWEITKRITNGTGSYNHPSIAAVYSAGMDVLCVVWQKKIGIYWYDIMYSISSDMGTSWLTPAVVPGCSSVVVSSNQSGPGSTPVVAGFPGYNGPQGAFLLVYAAENGLHYRYSNSWYTGWIIPASDIIPGSEGSNSRNWYPSLATYNSQDSYGGFSRVNLTYDNRYNNVYSQIFTYLNGATSWTNRVQVSSTGDNNRRAAEIADTSDISYLRIELSEPVITLTNGDQVKIPFKAYNYLDTLELSTENIFDYLQTERINIPNNAQSVTFKVEINATQPDILSDGTLNTNPQTPFRIINFGLLARDSSRTLLNNIGNHLLSNLSGIHHYSKEFTVSALILRGRNIRVQPNINLSGTFNQNNLYFTLVNVSIEGDSLDKYSPRSEEENTIPTDFSLEQNYPNPFNPSTQIRYSVVEDGLVRLQVYDLLGREIATLVNEHKQPGSYEVSWDASRFASGIYFYTLTSGNFISTKKLILLR